MSTHSTTAPQSTVHPTSPLPSGEGLGVGSHIALHHIRALTPDPTKFIRPTARGYVDWKFSQVAAYLGYPAARQYAEAMRRWHDYADKYRGCILDQTFTDFLTAEAREAAAG